MEADILRRMPIVHAASKIAQANTTGKIIQCSQRYRHANNHAVELSSANMHGQYLCHTYCIQFLKQLLMKQFTTEDLKKFTFGPEQIC